MRLNDIVGYSFSDIVNQQKTVFAGKKHDIGTWAFCVVDESSLFSSGAATHSYSVVFSTGDGYYTSGNSHYNKEQAIKSAIDLAACYIPPIELKGAIELLSKQDIKTDIEPSCKSEQMNIKTNEGQQKQNTVELIKKYTCHGQVYVNLKDFENPRKIIIPMYAANGEKIDECNCTKKQRESLAYIGVHKENLFDSKAQAIKRSNEILEEVFSEAENEKTKKKASSMSL